MPNEELKEGMFSLLIQDEDFEDICLLGCLHWNKSASYCMRKRQQLHCPKVEKLFNLIKESGYIKLADIDYKYLPTKECYCYDNGWRKVEME